MPGVPGTYLRRLRDNLARLEREGLRRHRDAHAAGHGPYVAYGQHRLANFSSNDYLGLADHPRVLERVMHELPRFGFGARAAALLSGRSTLHEELETCLAQFCSMPSALLFSSGYLANVGTLAALVTADDLVAHDRLNHASLIDGVLASRARHRRYPHCDTAAARRILDAARGDCRFLVTESVFSMDGDCAPLAELANAAAATDAALYVDDAHGFGITGANGRGACADLQGSDTSLPLPAIVVLTFGKALGGVGAAVLADVDTIEWLVQRARTYVFDTALPPVCAAAAIAALDVLRDEPERRQRLQGNIAFFRQAAHAAHLPLLPSQTAIQPVMVGDPAPALAIAADLREAGFYVRAVRPPTVPRGTARLRITLSADHPRSCIEDLVTNLAAACRRHLPVTA